MADDRVDNLPPHDRRRFFRAGLRKILSPVANYIEGRILEPSNRPVAPPVLLRPPGALPEPQFLETCLRCGNCSSVCPAEAITLYDDTRDRARLGTPHVMPGTMACVVCDDLSCMKACPSGALRLVDRFAIRMGIARVNEAVCLRTAGEDCRLCVDQCPIREEAIDIVDGAVHVFRPTSDAGHGCVGCGVCQQACPTTPKAIEVIPIR